MMSALRLIQLNIERERHLDRVLPFLAEQNPEVACIQELRESEIPSLEHAFGATCFFVPMAHHDSMRDGVGIFSRLPIVQRGSHCYAGAEGLREFDKSTPDTVVRSQNYMLAWCDVEKEGTTTRIATTHFPWTPDGEVSEFQRKSVQALLKALSSLGEVVVCGDFNAPRGGEIFKILTEHLTDNVPLKYQSSLDPKLHRAGHLNRMVDDIFSTKGYAVSDVEMRCGISDHCALIATVHSTAQ
jgi:endonuclease/exonuclease/phosphatase family metal-dependent hydrolase